MMGPWLPSLGEYGAATDHRLYLRFVSLLLPLVAIHTSKSSQGILDRIVDAHTLSAFHCGEIWQLDENAMIEAARYVKLLECNFQNATWYRISYRQKKEIRMDGVTGRVTYKGNLEPFLPLLAAGELLHIGKATVFGQGLYQPNKW